VAKPVGVEVGLALFEVDVAVGVPKVAVGVGVAVFPSLP